MKFQKEESYFKETTASSRLIFDGKVLHLYRDEINLPDGGTSMREYCKHNGAVAVVPLTDKGEVVCIRQYRYALPGTHDPYGEDGNDVGKSQLDARNRHRGGDLGLYHKDDQRQSGQQTQPGQGFQFHAATAFLFVTLTEVCPGVKSLTLVVSGARMKKTLGGVLCFT